MVIRLIDKKFTVSKLSDYADYAECKGQFLFTARTDNCVSVISETQYAPKNALKREDGFCALVVEGQLDFSLVGILSEITAALADKGVAVFAISTYDTDYVLVKAERINDAVSALLERGFEISGTDKKEIGKTLYFTDIHGSMAAMERIKEIVKKEEPSFIVFLGDMYYHGPRNKLSDKYAPMEVAAAVKNIGIPYKIVKGNCDAQIDETISGVSFPRIFTIKSGEKRIFCSHGDKFNVDNPPSDGYDFVFYGHTHLNRIQEKNGTIFINLASAAVPKEDAEKRYIISENGKVKVKSFTGELRNEF